MSYKLSSKIIKFVYPDGQRMLVNLSQVSRVYTDNTSIVFVTTEATNPARFFDSDKIVCKKVNLELLSTNKANEVFDDIVKLME